jgi:hypothetical protein
MGHEKFLLTAMPPAPVRGLGELYAVAFDLASRAAERYGSLAQRTDDNVWPVRGVFEQLASRERDRAASLSAACLAALGEPPDTADLRWTPVDLVPASEISEIANSGLSTPYAAWALAARQRQRAFAFWTYVIALADDTLVRATAEGFAREALFDGNLLRRERRDAWHAERNAGAAAAANSGEIEPASAALLESLLLKDIVAWSQGLDPVRRERLSALHPSLASPAFLTSADLNETGTRDADVEQVKRRALRRAEQLSNIYLDEADRAADQSSMELAQKLAAQSILRLAGLRQLASGTELR